MARVKRRQAAQAKKYPLLYLIPLIAVLAFIPAVIYQYNVRTNLKQYGWFKGGRSVVDFFLWTKSIWLYLTFGLIVFLMLYMIFSEEIKPVWDAILIPLIIYGVLCLISACFSIDKAHSFGGIYEQYESVWMLLGYVLLVYYAFYNLHSEESVKRLMPWFIGGIAFLTFIGLCQAFGYDPIENKQIQKLFLTENRLLGRLKLKFGKGRTYMTLYNPNYVGYYAVLTIPVVLVLLLHAKKMWVRLLYGVLIGGLLICLFASQSRAGILTLGVALLILILFMRKIFLKKWYVPVVIIVIAIAGFFVVDQRNNNVLTQRLQGMFRSEKEVYPLESIVTGDDVTFTINGNECHITEQVEEDEVSFELKDQDGRDIAYEQITNSEEIVVTDERFPLKLGVIERSSFNGFYVVTTLNQKINGVDVPTKKRWSFTNQVIPGDDSYYTIAGGSSQFKLEKVEKGLQFFEDHYSLANNRGYIWAKTCLILKKYPLLGSGPDTFLIAFPNHDLVGIYNSGHGSEMITKPHCLYLQIAAQTGIPSLIAFLVFFGWYVVSGIRLYWREDYSSYMSKIGVAMLVSVIGYLIVGLTNDSCITVSPVFFVLTGMGLGINHYLRTEQKAAQAEKSHTK